MRQKMKFPFLLFALASTFINSADYHSRKRICPKNALYKDGFNIQLYTGPSPIIWADRGPLRFSTGNSCSNPAGNVIANMCIPQFRHLFATPWTVGTTLGYAITHHHEVFGECNYTQAANKEYFTANVTNAAGASVLLQTNLVTNYKNISAYAGYRYNCNRWGKMVSLFLDAKLGFINHWGIKGFINSSLTTNIVNGSTTPFFTLFKNSTALSGAGKIGVDICLNQDWSLLIGAQVAAAWGPQRHHASVSVTELASTTITTGKIGAEILFPVTVGLRYRF